MSARKSGYSTYNGLFSKAGRFMQLITESCTDIVIDNGIN